MVGNMPCMIVGYWALREWAEGAGDMSNSLFALLVID